MLCDRKGGHEGPHYDSTLKWWWGMTEPPKDLVEEK